MPQFENDPRYAAVIGATEGETILAINNARPPLDDIRVRRALAHAIDRSEEHTSELQSLMRISYAVFCLKKKNKHISITTLYSIFFIIYIIYTHIIITTL